VILPVLILIVLACVDFGRFAYNHIAVANAARAGTAYGAMNDYTSATQSTWQAGVRDAVVDEISLQAGYDPAMTVNVTRIDVAGDHKRVQVEVIHPFQTIVNWPGIPNSINLRRVVVMRALRP
jgi:hypothetical protein